MGEQVSGGGSGALIVMSIIYLAIFAVAMVSMWKIFEKAGKPGWAALVPFYNIYVMLEIVGRPGWWLVLLLIPCVNIIVFVIISMDMAVSFGKSKGWGFVMLVILGLIGYIILAFSDAKYEGPKAG